MTNAEKIAARKNKVVYVDHCSMGSSIEARAMIASFHDAFVSCVLDGAALPEDIADMFAIDIVDVDGEPRGILRWA